MRVLITGADGFAGAHLVEHSLAQGDEVWGTARSGLRLQRLPLFLDQITVRVGDVTRPEFLRGVLSEARFDVVYHLAGISFFPRAEQDPGRAYLVNVLGGLYLFEALREKQPDARLLLVSSGEVYGRVPPEKMPIVEAQSRAPGNTIAASKAALEMAAAPYLNQYGLKIVVVRPFNHIGPWQDTDYVCSSFAGQVAKVEAGAEKVIRVGNLTPKRDFTDVRDTVRGYRLLALHGVPGEAYNLASERSVAIQHVLDLLIQMARVKVQLVEDEERMRRSQVMDVRGSFQKAHECCNWKPEIPLEKSLRDLLNWHRDLLFYERR